MNRGTAPGQYSRFPRTGRLRRQEVRKSVQERPASRSASPSQAFRGCQQGQHAGMPGVLRRAAMPANRAMTFDTKMCMFFILLFAVILGKVIKHIKIFKNADQNFF